MKATPLTKRLLSFTLALLMMFGAFPVLALTAFADDEVEPAPKVWTDEDYAKEVDYINENFDAIVAAPFYGDEINAFVMSAEGIIGYSAEYICESAIVFAVVFGVVELLLIGLTLFALDFRRKGT